MFASIKVTSENPGAIHNRSTHIDALRSRCKIERCKARFKALERIQDLAFGRLEIFQLKLFRKTASN
jgi:hypothetical protein